MNNGNFCVDIERTSGEMEFDSFQFDEEYRYDIETFIHELYKKTHHSTSLGVKK